MHFILQAIFGPWYLSAVQSFHLPLLPERHHSQNNQATLTELSAGMQRCQRHQSNPDQRLPVYPGIW